jgi:hypothetical protein
MRSSLSKILVVTALAAAIIPFVDASFSPSEARECRQGGARGGQVVCCNKGFASSVGFACKK